MDRPQIEAIIAQITYKKGWTVRVKPYDHVADTNGLWARQYLQIVYDGTGEYGTEPWTGRKWVLSQHMTRTEIVYTAFKAVLAAEEHETRELFKYKGQEVCGPHFDVDDIVALIVTRRLHHDVRSDAMQGV